jgi:serralysin
MPLTSLNDATLDDDASAREAANPDDLIWTGFGRVTETADAAASTATAYDLIVGQSGAGVLSSAADQDWFAIELVAGQTYDFRLLGFDSNFLSDPRIRLMNGSGVQLAENDDGFSSAVPTSTADPHAFDSRLIFTATTTGTHYLVADNFDTQTGRYLISATEHDPAGMVFTVDEIAWQLINNGVAYFGSPEGAGFNVGGDGALTVNITGLTAAGRTLAQEALAVWSAYTGIAFQFTTGVAEITFDDNQSGAFAQPSYSGGAIVSSTVNVGLDWLASFGTGLQSYSFETYIHEIGHALGLGHGGNYNGSANYNSDNFYLNDSLAWTIMSYMNADNDEFDFGGANDWNTYVDAAFRYMYSPMIADMIAVQELYGVSSAFAGNTTWGFGSNTGVAAFDQAVNSGALMAMTVYDTGGTDTLNFANSSANQTISLMQESLSSVLGGRNNLGIARGTVIENAIGGSGNDTMVGNASNNRLDGGLGNDTMRGLGGDDSYIVRNAGDRVLETAGQGTADRVYASVSYVLTSGAAVEILSTTSNDSTASINLTGNALGQTILGNAGANRIESGIGAADTLRGLGGNDSYIVRNAGDRVLETAGEGTTDRVYASVSYVLTSGAAVEVLSTTADSGTGSINLTGNALAQTILGNAGANRIESGIGAADTLRGLGGNDSYIVRNAGDRVLETAEQGTADRVYASVSYVLTSGAAVEILSTTADSGTGSINLTGNALAQTILGNAGNNRLESGIGAADTLRGLGGNDTYIVRNASDRVLEIAGQGTADRVVASMSYVLTSGADVEILSTTSDAGTGSINLTGNALAQTILGNAGVNRLTGLGGRDVFNGLGGNDHFIFNAGDSVLGTNRDVINDFEDRGDDDTINLAGFAGTLAFVSDNAFTAANQVRAVESGANVVIQINTGGTLAADSEILLLNTTLAQVTSSDFVL